MCIFFTWCSLWSIITQHKYFLLRGCRTWTVQQETIFKTWKCIAGFFIVILIWLLTWDRTTWAFCTTIQHIFLVWKHMLGQWVSTHYSHSRDRFRLLVEWPWYYEFIGQTPVITIFNHLFFRVTFNRQFKSNICCWWLHNLRGSV